MAGHTHWRLGITEIQAHTVCYLSEIQLRATPGGQDQCTGGVASSSGDAGATYNADKAFDDNVNTFWGSNATTPMWIQYVFASAVTVEELVIRSVAGAGTTAPKDFFLAWSDNGRDWYVQLTRLDEAAWGEGESRVFAVMPEVAILAPANNAIYPVMPTVRWEEMFGAESYSVWLSTNGGAFVLQAADLTDPWYAIGDLLVNNYVVKVEGYTEGAVLAAFSVTGFRIVPAGALQAHEYWRINITEVQSVIAPAIVEIELRATIGGADQCTGGTPTDSSNAGSTWNAAKAFDDNTSTRWQAANSTLPQWVAYQFAAAVQVMEFLVRSYTTTQALKDWDLQYSDDGNTWTTAWSITDERAWAANESRVFSVVFPTVVDPPGAFTAPVAGTYIIGDALQISWGAAADFDFYELFYTLDGGGRVALATNILTEGYLWDTGLATPGAYVFWLRTVLDGVESDWVTSDSVALEEGTPSVPQLEYERQADFASLEAAYRGTSIARRPDAVSLDYLTAFAPGPVALQDTSGGLLARAWRARVAGSRVLLARANAGNTGWMSPEIPLEDELSGIVEMDFAFTQNADPTVAAERDGHIWIYWFDPLESAFVWQDFGPGRTPRVVLDDVRTVIGESDVQVFYIDDALGSVVHRQQRERYATVHEVPVPATANTYLEDIVTGKDRRLHVIYSVRNTTLGQYALGRFSTFPFPLLLDPESVSTEGEILGGELQVAVIIRTLDPESFDVEGAIGDSELQAVLVTYDVYGEIASAITLSEFDAIDIVLDGHTDPEEFDVEGSVPDGTLQLVVFERTLESESLEVWGEIPGGTLEVV